MGAGDAGESVIPIHGGCGRADRPSGEANRGRPKSISAGTAHGLERLERTTPGATGAAATAAGGIDFRAREPDQRDVLGQEETSGAQLPNNYLTRQPAL